MSQARKRLAGAGMGVLPIYAWPMLGALCGVLSFLVACCMYSPPWETKERLGSELLPTNEEDTTDSEPDEEPGDEEGADTTFMGFKKGAAH